MPLTPVKVGVVGCGNICSIYFQNANRLPILEVVACADLVSERAEAAAREHGIPRCCSTEELLADPEIELILNLTIPKAHAQVALAAIQAGKSVYNEKPLAISRADGKRLLEAARERGVLLGGAPDTFMGAGLQTCRKLIDDGWIGFPVAAAAFMTCHGHESWHPDPEFYYQLGGGPMFDMGPYYLTALISLLGPVRRVTGLNRITFPERLITSQPKAGTRVTVEVPTHVLGLLEFASGALATIVMSFDIWHAALPNIEIYGSEGSLRAPDPNTFGGPVSLRRATAPEWSPIPLSHPYPDNSRGLGPADLAYALRTGRPHRPSAELCYHVLDLMHAFHEAADQGRHITLESTCDRPAPLPMDLAPWTLDE